MASSVDKPRLVLRVGVAGAIKLTDDQRVQVAARLSDVLGVLVRQIEQLAPASGADAGRPGICSYYAHPSPNAADGRGDAGRPTLRLVSGLADGSDQIAFESLLALEQCAAGAGGGERGHARARFELVAILPSDVASFRDNSAVKDTRAFDALLARCAYVLELDGICPPESEDPGPAGRLAGERRNRSFRVQAAVLVRQCDVLIAVADPAAAGNAGGTRETMTNALALGVPVIFVSSAAADGESGVSVLRRRGDLERTLGCSCAAWKRDVEQTVVRILADPRTTRAGAYPSEPTGAAAGLRAGEAQLLDEFFDGAERVATIRPAIWSWFERRFRCLTVTGADRPLAPFQRYAERAGRLSAFYTGLYRGAFLVIYGLAVVAVGLAVATLMSLVVLARHRAPESAGALALTVTSAAELAVLVAIILNTHQGNRSRWNAKAIDYRYLAERLRSSYYLPLVADLRVSPPRAAQYAPTAFRQSVADWLLQAIVRDAPPDTGLQPLQPLQPPTPGAPRFAAADVGRALASMKANWLETQIAYHRRTSDTQLGMHRWIERWVWRLNLAVIIIVSIDLLTMLLRLGGVGAAWLETVHGYGPALVALAAVLPAVVASLNGIRFQSECLRIAERSAVMVQALEGCRAECDRLAQEIERSRAAAADPGAWTLEALDLAESCAQMAGDEVAEWSVLYSKDLLDV